VVLDEAGALLEPDAVGCLLHGARALLLVGDHYQLPPFSKWQGAVRLLYCLLRALIDP
jgi:superfamily I DNA and/or RNA helicase